MREFELAALGSVKSFLKRASSRHAPPPGTLCANCDTELAGLYCHACGQAADNHHRNLWHLIWEGIEGLFHMDGRLWRTLPPLFFRPGLLARDYMVGRIARHVPPFRTFLVSLLLFIFAAEGLIHKAQHDAKHDAAHAEASHNEAGPAKANKDSEKPAAVVTLDGPKSEHASASQSAVGFDDVFSMSAEDRQKLSEKIKTGKTINTSISDPETSKAMIEDLKLKLSKAVQNPELFILNVFTMGHRLAVLLLPIMSLLLGLLYAYKRQFFIFEHFLVSCNILSFMFLTNAFGFILPEFVRGYWFMLLMVWTPVNIFMTLRGAYGSGIFGALIKTALLWTTTTLSFAVLVVWLSWLALNAM